MEFFIHQNSPLTVPAQLQDQVKLALLVGRLRPGDTLPSIRDVAKQVGVNRGVVHKAYVELQNTGILSLKHGKGVLVEKEVKYDHQDIGLKSELLSDKWLAELRNSRVCPSAFARYLYQKARALEDTFPFVIFVDITLTQATERARRISSIWQVNVQGVSFDQVSTLGRKELSYIGKALTTYFRLDRVRQLLRKTPIEVVPVGLKVKLATVEEFRNFPSSGSVLVVTDNRDHASGPFVIDLYKREFLPPSTTVTATTVGKISDLVRLVNSSKHDRIIFATSLWEGLPDKVKKHPRVTHPQLDVDLASLESARIRSGVIF